ncbi:MAG: hypothetical protein RLY45_1269 [Actinomycetota bacterium]|jgi:diguanylate cyclase (GGDEF)-like protein
MTDTRAIRLDTVRLDDETRPTPDQGAQVVGQPPTADLDDIRTMAVEARRTGEFERAAALFGTAASASRDSRTRLDLQIRQACCLLSVDRSADAAALASDVAHHARADGHLVELADALGVQVDHYVKVGRLAEASHLLSEAIDVLDRLPDSPDAYQVTHNLAATHEHSGFYEAAITLFERALALADTAEDRCFTRASMTSAYHFAAARATDPEECERLLVAGLDAAAAIECDSNELLTTCAALAHSSMMLARIGRYEDALDHAARCRAVTAGRGLVEDEMFATAAESIAEWRLRRDPIVLGKVTNTLRVAEHLRHLDILAVLQDVEIEILWTLGRYDEARRTLENHLESARHRMATEQLVRWAHVRLGVDHRKVSILSTTDPLTGLHNRRHLEHVLPDLFASADALCVAIVDLDGFKQVNDQHGYALGDSVIREVAAILEQSCRRDDTVARLGGDEFVIVLRGADAHEGHHVLERLRATVAAHVFVGVPADLPLSASIGVVALQRDQRRDVAGVLAEAGAALRQSKRGGRNRVTFSACA